MNENRLLDLTEMQPVLVKFCGCHRPPSCCAPQRLLCSHLHHVHSSHTICPSQGTPQSSGTPSCPTTWRQGPPQLLTGGSASWPNSEALSLPSSLLSGCTCTQSSTVLTSLPMLTSLCQPPCRVKPAVHTVHTTFSDHFSSPSQSLWKRRATV